MSADSLPDTFPCACCSHETEREYKSETVYDRGQKRVIVNRHHATTYAIGHVCQHCASSIKESAAKPRKAIPGILGDAAFYGSSSAYAIPAHNPGLRRYVAAVDAGKIEPFTCGGFSSGKPRKTGKRKPATPRADYCKPGGTHPRLSAYFRAVERGAIPAPFRGTITYADGVAPTDSQSVSHRLATHAMLGMRCQGRAAWPRPTIPPPGPRM